MRSQCYGSCAEPRRTGGDANGTGLLGGLYDGGALAIKSAAAGYFVFSVAGGVFAIGSSEPRFTSDVEKDHTVRVRHLSALGAERCLGEQIAVRQQGIGPIAFGVHSGSPDTGFSGQHAEFA